VIFIREVIEHWICKVVSILFNLLWHYTGLIIALFGECDLHVLTLDPSLRLCVCVCGSLIQGKSALFIIQTVASLALVKAARCRCAPNPRPARPTPVTLIRPLHPVRSLFYPADFWNNQDLLYHLDLFSLKLSILEVAIYMLHLTLLIF